VTSLEMPGPLISKSQSGRVNLRATQQIGRTWTERYLVNVRSVNGRALLAFIDDVWRNGTTFTIDHRDHLTPLGTGGGSPLVNAAPQLVTDPENFALWTAENTPILTSGQADPSGGTLAYLHNDDSAVNAERIIETVTFTGDGEKAFGLSMRGGNSATSLFGIFDLTAGVWRHRVGVTWTASVPTLSDLAGAGTLFPVVYQSGSGATAWYRLLASATGVVAANTNRFYIGATGDSPTLTGTTFIFGANAWNSPVPLPYRSTTGVPVITGSSLVIDGATASISNWLRAGDIISIGGLAPIYEVSANVNSLVGGHASIPINPPIFTGGAPGDNAVITITGVTLTACILEPPTYPTTSGLSADYGELVCKFSESL
jgi:hypothetical protein